MKILAVGDIHTKAWVIDQVEALLPQYDMVVFCGDYADDWGASGSETTETWLRLWYLQYKHGDKIRLVLGNHDYAYLHPVGCSGHNDIAQLLINNPENSDLKNWLYSLPITLEIDGVTYSHAGIDERWDGSTDSASMWQDTSPLWVRPSWAQYKAIPQVVGHTPQETVTEVHPGIWSMDTFSTYPDGRPIGDGSMLEVVDGKHFVVLKRKGYVKEKTR